MSDSFSELIQREQAKRDRNWDPALRWKVIQNTLARAESQSTVHRNTKAACLAHQACLIAQFAASAAKS